MPEGTEAGFPGAGAPGAPLVGLTFSLAGRGRIGFAVLAALWSGAILVLRGLDI